MTAPEPTRVLEPLLPRTYPHAHLDHWTNEDWARIPVTWVPIRDLTPSQEAVSLAALARLMNGDPSESGDWAGRAIRHDGTLHLHDGHHRWLLALVRGDDAFPVRAVEVSS